MADTSTDILVIGDGMAGVMAAVAARETGASVRIVSRSRSASTLSSGAIDLAGGLGATPASAVEEQTDLRTNLAALLQRDPWNPFHRVAAEFDGDEAKAGHVLRLFNLTLNLLEERGGYTLASHTERNQAWITQAGTVKFAAAAQASMAALDPTQLREIRPLFIGIAGLPGMLASRQAVVFDEIRGAASSRASYSAEISFPEAIGPNSSAIGFASLLDDEQYATRFGEALSRAAVQAPGADLIVIPPVLGISRTDTCRKLIAEIVALPVRETLAVPPSAPGIRLEFALEQILKKAAIGVIRGEVLPESHKGQVRSVRIRKSGGEEETIRCNRVVLASGKFLSGGLRKEGAIAEALFGLPVFWHGEPFRSVTNEEIFDRRLFAEQAAFGTGLKLDDQLRPVDEAIRPVFENLYAAGSVLGGYDSVAGPCGLGMALVTGYAAGQKAGAK